MNVNAYLEMAAFVAVVAAGVLWIASQFRHWLTPLLGGLVGLLVIVAAFLLGAALYRP